MCVCAEDEQRNSYTELWKQHCHISDLKLHYESKFRLKRRLNYSNVSGVTLPLITDCISVSSFLNHRIFILFIATDCYGPYLNNKVLQ